MEVLTLNHHPQCLRASFHYSLTPSTSSSSSSLFFNPHHPSSVVASLSDPPLQYPHPKSLQFFNTLRKVPSFVTVTAASAFLFLGFCQNGSIKKSLSSVVSIQDASDEKGKLEEDLVGDHVESILHLKLKERVPVVHDLKKTRITDEEAWQVLKAEVLNSSGRLEFVKVGFEEILEKNREAFHDCVLEHLERIDECKTLLKEIKVAMDRCERRNANLEYSLRFFSKVVAHVRVLEESMLHALKYYQELDKD